MKYKVQAVMEVIVEANNVEEAKQNAKIEIIAGSDIKILGWGYIGEINNDI